MICPTYFFDFISKRSSVNKVDDDLSIFASRSEKRSERILSVCTRGVYSREESEMLVVLVVVVGDVQLVPIGLDGLSLQQTFEMSQLLVQLHRSLTFLQESVHLLTLQKFFDDLRRFVVRLKRREEEIVVEGKSIRSPLLSARPVRDENLLRRAKIVGRSSRDNRSAGCVRAEDDCIPFPLLPGSSRRFLRRVRSDTFNRQDEQNPFSLSR